MGCGRDQEILAPESLRPRFHVRARGIDNFLTRTADKMNNPEQVFTSEVLRELFPPERANEFFEALFGDAEEGAYDIELGFEGYDKRGGALRFVLNLHERPGQCLACNLTYGLPEVFGRHPLINIKGLVRAIEHRLGGGIRCGDWQLGSTIQKGRSLHCIPLTIAISLT